MLLHVIQSVQDPEEQNEMSKQRWPVTENIPVGGGLVQIQVITAGHRTLQTLQLLLSLIF